MNKILFLKSLEIGKLQKEIKSQLTIKNRLIKVLEENENHKLSISERQEKLTRYHDQIFLLNKLQESILKAKTREDINSINTMIELYKKYDTPVTEKKTETCKTEAEGTTLETKEFNFERQATAIVKVVNKEILKYEKVNGPFLNEREQIIFMKSFCYGLFYKRYPNDVQDQLLKLVLEKLSVKIS